MVFLIRLLRLYLASRICVKPAAILAVCDNLGKANGVGGGFTSTHPAWVRASVPACAEMNFLIFGM